MGPMENLVNQTLGSDVLHVHLERCMTQEGNVQLGALLGVEATFDTIVNERHQACCNNDTEQISREQ